MFGEADAACPGLKQIMDGKFRDEIVAALKTSFSNEGQLVQLLLFVLVVDKGFSHRFC